MNTKKTPIYRDTAFNLENAISTKKAFDQEANHPHEPENYIYSRYRNPTVVAAEKQLAEIESAEWSLLFSSGMAAIDSAVSIFQSTETPRPWLFFNDIYGGTHSYLQLVQQQRRSQEVIIFKSENQQYNYSKLEETIAKHKPAFVFFETISNPMLLVADSEKIIETAHKYGTAVIIDNTFASPFLYKPLKQGADLVLHSATKYLAGHGNLMAGVVSGNNNTLMQQLIEYRKWVGNNISPDEAYRLSTQSKTFNLRFATQTKNAYQLANTLQVNPKIEQVYYPGLESHPTYEQATQLFGKKGFGAMINFSIAGKDNDQKISRTTQFIQILTDEIQLLPTLGDTETTLLPVGAVWSNNFSDPGMIRLSVGIEKFTQLEHTINKALKLL